MNQEVKTVLKKTAKIAGVTCLTLGGAALIASGAAVKALTEGAKYLKDAVKEIAREEPRAEEIVEEAAEVTVEEPVAAEEDFTHEEAPAANE